MLVSVIIPCYNQGKYLSDALNSILNQTYANWECLIVDDGSTDNTQKIAKDWVKKDNRFVYLQKENGGVSSARNYGIKKAKGNYLQFLDCDDLLASKKLELSLAQIDLPENKDIKMVISNFQMISEDLKEISPPFCDLTKNSLTFENFLFNFFSIQIQCGFFEVSLFKSIRFPENLSAQEDWIVWIKILKLKRSFVFIDLPLATYRINPNGRMNTVGADDNQIKIFSLLKEMLTYDEYHKFSILKFTEFYKLAKSSKTSLKLIKSSKTYKFSSLIKKALKMFGLLELIKRIIK